MGYSTTRAGPIQDTNLERIPPNDPLAHPVINIKDLGNFDFDGIKKFVLHIDN